MERKLVKKLSPDDIEVMKKELKVKFEKVIKQLLVEVDVSQKLSSYSVEGLCKILDISPKSYYNFIKYDGRSVNFFNLFGLMDLLNIDFQRAVDPYSKEEKTLIDNFRKIGEYEQIVLLEQMKRAAENNDQTLVSGLQVADILGRIFPILKK